MTTPTTPQALDEIPPLPGHPEPRVMTWSALELACIAQYGRQCWDAALLRANAAVPSNWEQSLWAAMEGAFRLGKHHDEGIVVDDTQVGVEFAIKHFKAMLASAPPAPLQAEPSSTRPYNPTQAMIQRAKDIDPALPLENIRALWCAMWTAAPQPIEQSEPAELAPAVVDERKEFEEAAVRLGWPSTAPAAYWRSEEKDYASNLLSSGWTFWQARATLAQAAPLAQVTEDMIDTALSAACFHSTKESRKDMRAALVAALARASLPVGEVILFGGDPDLKEVSWRKGQMPPPGAKLYTAPAQPAALTDHTALLTMIANRAVNFPSYSMGTHLPEVFEALGLPQPDAQPAALVPLTEALSIAREALDEIALAGMSGTGQESEEGMRDWHARQAWKFIGIAARAKTAIATTKEQG